MTITINIKGKGKVDKVVGDDSTTLTATPSETWIFKCFKVGENEYSDNPHTFLFNEENLIIDTFFYIPIEAYLRGFVGFDVPESALTSILKYRKIDFNTDVDDLSQKQIDLAYADMLMWASTNPSSYTGSKESDGGWSRTEASKTISVTDKKRYAKSANEIYIKYNDSKKSRTSIIATSWNGVSRI